MSSEEFKKSLKQDININKKMSSIEEFHDIEDIPLIEGSDFNYKGGSLELVTASFIYLIKKHKDDICYIITEDSDNLFYKCDENNKPRLEVPKGFKEFFLKCTKTRRFTIVGVIIETKTKDCNEKETSHHFNILIYDKQTGILENFEPDGSSFVNPNFDIAVEEYFIKNKLISKYYPSIRICPYIGPQYKQELEHIKLKISREGFCIMWCIWYADLRLTFPDIRPKQIQKDAMSNINNIGFDKFIIRYTKFVINFIRIIKDKYKDALIFFRNKHDKKTGSILFYKYIINSELKLISSRKILKKDQEQEQEQQQEQEKQLSQKLTQEQDQEQQLNNSQKLTQIYESILKLKEFILNLE